MNDVEITHFRTADDDRLRTAEAPLSLSVGVRISVDGASLPNTGGIGFHLRELVMGFVFWEMGEFVAGERDRALASAGESYLVFEREPGGRVRVTHCYTEETAENPGERLDAEPSIVADCAPLVEEILRAADELVELLLVENENMHDRYRPTLQNCRERIDELRRIVDANES